MPSKSGLSEFSFSARAEFDRCQSCFRTAQSLVLLTLVCVFVLFVLILGLDICKAQTDSGWCLTFIIVLDITAMLALALGIRGVALEKRCLAIIFVIIFVLLIILHSVLFTSRHRGISIFTLILDCFVTIIGIVFISIYFWFDSVKPADYKQIRREARARARNVNEEKTKEIELA